MLDPKFLAEQKKRLLAEKKELETSLQARGGKFDKKVKNVEDYNVDPPKLSAANEPTEDDLEAQEVEGYTNRLALEDNLEHKLDDVNVALKKLNEGKYGECENCPGKTIPQKRLEALPSARICLDCEQKNDK